MVIFAVNVCRNCTAKRDKFCPGRYGKKKPFWNDHIKDVAASIKAVTDTSIGSSSAYQNLPKRVSLAAGETIGWYLKGLNSIAWDFIVQKSGVTKHFANQDGAHVVAMPLDAFIGDGVFIVVNDFMARQKQPSAHQ